MKKILIVLVLFLFFNLQIFSQDNVFKPFKVDCGFTTNTPTCNKTGSGIGIFIEPRYGVNEKLTLGLRIENDFLNSGNIEINYTSVKVNSIRIFSMMLTGDCFFSTENVRPFIGIGLGMYKRYTEGVSVHITDINVGSTSNTYFCFQPRAGLNLRHFRLAAIYSYTGNEISDYAGIQLGIELGGGRINK